jgi:predicted nucleic acid-binding Zn ribbon protein
MSQQIYNRLVSNGLVRPDKSSREPQALGGVLGDYLRQQIGPKQAQWEALQQLWQELVPEHIASHCSLADFAEGRLTVVVDSPGYAHELRLLGSGLMRQMRKNLPQLKIRKMTTVLR